jgi:NAD-dependent SIR2 family protein deacetylase
MTGAGFGVDSGLPDFRGSSGLWNQVPNLRHKSFFEMANP